MSQLSDAGLLGLAIDLTRSLTNSDRFDRLLDTIRSTIRCDAVVLLARQNTELRPLAQHGLTPDSLGRRFHIEDHPRFAEICASKYPIRFPTGSPLPDPYDGIMLTHAGELPIHACMGLPLHSDNQLIGVLTLDSMSPNIFDNIPQRTLEIISLMSAAALKTAIMLEQLEDLSQHRQQVVVELTLEALNKDGGELIGQSAAMQKLKQDITIVAPSDFSVLIEGETGVGKELVARTIHRQSSRAHGPLVYVNCAAIPENLIESELFGHIKGAFTGADNTRAGKFSLADKGTIFLDEIGELPLAAQSKLLRALQSQEIQPVGQDTVTTIDTRVLAATNRVLKTEVAAGRFRADLYHRLSVYPIHIPPLRQRSNDIPILAGHFCETLRRKMGLQHLTLEIAALDRLSRYSWPGNIRELEHAISRAALTAKSNSSSRITKITEQHLAYLVEDTATLAAQISPSTEAPTPADLNLTKAPLKLRQATEQFQGDLILAALAEHQGNWTESAKMLGLDRANLSRLAKRLGITVEKTIKSAGEHG